MNEGEAEKAEDRIKPKLDEVAKAVKPKLDDVAKDVKSTLSDDVQMHETDAIKEIRLRELDIFDRALKNQSWHILFLIASLLAIFIFSIFMFSDKPEFIVAIVAAATGPILGLAQVVRIKTPKSDGQQGGNGPSF